MQFDVITDGGDGAEHYPGVSPRPLTLLYTTFQDHAVLQRDKTIPVWGLAAPGATVTVTFAGETGSAQADGSGQWKLTLPALGAGGPYELSAVSSTGESQTVRDVMIGDVYLCSGQSNMEFPVRIAGGYDIDMISASNRDIRLFHVQRFSSVTPRSTFGADASWAVTSPESVKEFSAACYFFGRNLQPVINVPVGLIEASWGGSSLRTWVSTDKLRQMGGYEQQIALLGEYTRDPEAAARQWSEFTKAWWRSNDPALSAVPAWSDPAYNDSSWPQNIQAGNWENWGVPELSQFDGIVWVRESFTLTAAEAKGDATLSLGIIDDVDTTWVNGRWIGGTQGYITPRLYTLPAGTLHEGTNVIAVGVLDTGGGGGLWGPADDKWLKFADGSELKLNTPWRYRISVPLAQINPLTRPPWIDISGLSMLYNGMIAPLGPTQIKGVVWYQGEADAAQSKEYARLLPAFFEDWRQRFGADIPFLIVQLAGYGPASAKPEDADWAKLREVQRKTVLATAYTALAVTIDLGERDNIHPTNKQEVGRRLALDARKLIYGEDIVSQGPSPLSAVRKGNVVTLHFENTAKGMVIYESNRPISFQLCNAEKRCSFVDASLQGNTIELDASRLPDAAAVRFCWSDSPICNVYNSEGLPAVPFEIGIERAAPAPASKKNVPLKVYPRK